MAANMNGHKQVMQRVDESAGKPLPGQGRGIPLFKVFTRENGMESLRTVLCYA
jgi:hypothetical protein